jgi:hypothetical protein
VWKVLEVNVFLPSFAWYWLKILSKNYRSIYFESSNRICSLIHGWIDWTNLKTKNSNKGQMCVKWAQVLRGWSCDNFKHFLVPQLNGRTCVDFGCTHPINGLFWSLPIYLLGFFSQYECWVIDLIMLLCHFFLGCHFFFVSQGFILLWNIFKNWYG